MPSPWFAAGWAGLGAVLATAIRPLAQRLGATRRLHAAASPVIAASATSALFALLAWRIGAHTELPAFSCVALAAVPLAATDLVELRLPTNLIRVSGLAAAALFMVAAAFGTQPGRLLRALVGMLALGTAHLAIALASRSGLGAGDIRLAAFVGLPLGWRGWPALAAGTVIALSVASGVSLVMLASGRADRTTPIPYGPPMLAGAFAAIITIA